ncbi:hypothetical protein PBF_22192 [Cytobacillus firmus DS1]|uniref:Uncharacterized protein n=1 Tax=Cytobacillus firmus DS1 TaxID=1307436 RepID=W7KZW0_CYTFI|nr:hypothetical protein PBF_22192 [Cytobacillus firmus DS1]
MTFSKEIQIPFHSKAADNKAAAVEDTNNMDAGRIRQCLINLLLTRLKRADRRIQKIADPAADKGLCKGTSVHTSISSVYAYIIVYAWKWVWLGQIHYILRGNVGDMLTEKRKTLKGIL